MQKQSSNNPDRSIGLQDILFILCKHKWMIALCTLAGLGAAISVFLVRGPVYQSEAKLLVRYVLERSAVDPYQSQESPGARGAGEQVIGTEMEIFKSTDLATEVANAIGIDQLIPNDQVHAKPSDAARVILGNLDVGVGKSSNVLHVQYKNADSHMAKRVLRELVSRYFNRHLEIHRSAAAFDMVSKQVDEVRGRLETTEKELNRLRTESGIVSMSDGTQALSSQRSRIQEDLMRARAELAEQQASLQSLAAVLGKQPARTSGSTLINNSERNTEHLDDKTDGTPPHLVTEYRAIMELIAFLQKRDLELRVKYRSGNRLVEQNQQQIANSDARRRFLIEKYPQLANQNTTAAIDPSDPVRRYEMEKVKLAAVTARVQVFENNLKEITTQFGQQYAYGAQIDALERRRQMEEAEYRSLEANLKNARIDQTLDPSRMPNITIVEQPTEAIKTIDSKTKNFILGFAAGGMALGLGLAFLLELVLNRKIERPIEIQARLQLPLLLTIPFIRKNARGGLLLAGAQSPRRIADENWKAIDGNEGLSVNARNDKAEHFILPFSETIRDRVIFNFEVNNAHHKPKLIAVTAMSHGAGTSTIAAGLARAFSEIKDVKVLLVDLSSLSPQSNPVFGEMPCHSLPAALRLAQTPEFKERAQNLYYASATARRDNGSSSQFNTLQMHEMMPLMHASDYDYIIFDMPAITQTSPTVTMAGLMDKVLLILDGQNTSREGLKWGYSELIKGRADVSCVFNKSRSHGPDWLMGDH